MQLLSGSNNTYTGGTSINGGVLEFAMGRPMPASGGDRRQRAALAVSLGGPRGFTTARAGSGSIGGLISGIGGQRRRATWDSGAILGIDTTNASGTYSGNIPNSGNAPSGLLKLGGNILTLTGSNSYTGPTTINQGTLLVNGSLASPVTVNSGGMLGGSGSLTSVTVASGGSLSPGAAPAAMNVSGSLSLLSGAKMDYALDTPTDSDEVYMPSGPLVLSGQQFADFNFTPLGGFGRGTYTLIDTNSVPIGSLGTSNSGTIDGMPAYIAVQGDDVVLTVVPEPSTLVMLCIGGVVLLGWRWRRITDWLAVMESPMFRSRKWLILISAFRFGGIGLILGTAVAQAETISTLGAWSNSGSIGIEYFGPPPTGTPTFGQLVMVPTDGNNMINSFAFEMNLPSTVAFRGELYAWNGNEATGPDLYESPDLTTSRSGFQLVTFNTGKLVLIPRPSTSSSPRPRRTAKTPDMERLGALRATCTRVSSMKTTARTLPHGQHKRGPTPLPSLVPRSNLPSQPSSRQSLNRPHLFFLPPVHSACSPMLGDGGCGSRQRWPLATEAPPLLCASHRLGRKPRGVRHDIAFCESGSGTCQRLKRKPDVGRSQWSGSRA